VREDFETKPMSEPATKPPTLEWSTFWSERVAASRAPFLITLLGTSVVLALAVWPWLTGAPHGPGPLSEPVQLDSLAHTALGIELIASLWLVLFAWVKQRAGRRADTLILTAVLPWVAAGLGLQLRLSATGATSAQFAAVSLATALALALGLLAGCWSALADGRDLTRRPFLIATCAAGLGFALGLWWHFSGAPSFLFGSPTAVLVRPFELVPGVLLALSAVFLLPRLERRHPTVLVRAIGVSLWAFAVGQWQAALIHPAAQDHHALAAQLLPLAGHLILVVGLLLDLRLTLDLSGLALQEARRVNEALWDKTLEVQRIDLALTEREREKRKAEDRVRMLEKAVETMSLGLTITDSEGLIVYVNPADAAMHAYTVNELVGQPASVFAVDLEAAERAPSTLGVWSRERYNRAKDGRVFPVRLVSDVVRDEVGQPLAMVSISEDITERRQATEAVERRERILEAVALAAERFLLTPLAWDPDLKEVLGGIGLATDVDRVSLSIFGRHSTDTLTHHRWSARLEPTIHGLPETFRLPERWRLALARGETVAGSFQSLPEDEQQVLWPHHIGSLAVVPIQVQQSLRGFLSLETVRPDRTWTSIELEALRTAASTVGAAVSQSEAQEALTQSETQYRHLIEAASDLIQSVDESGTILFVNRAWLETLGYSLEETRGLPVEKVIRPLEWPHCAAVMERLFASGETERVEVVFLTKNGREIAVEGNVSVLLGEDGLPRATLGIFRDVSERRVVDQMKQEFVATVSHELRTPLTSVIGSLGLLKSGRLASQPERAAELIEVAHRNGERLLKLINDLLDLQKMAAGDLSLHLAPVEIQPLAAEALEAMGGLAESLGVQLELDCDVGPERRVLTDRLRAVQVLSNLLSNAIKFSPAGGRVTLAVGRLEEQVSFSVTDRGPGIPLEFRKRLFEKFAQADSSATRAAGGTGLGLSIVKTLVEGLLGQIEVDSEVGRGTTFRVQLPLAGGEKRT
jgi:PAS domain S-box-containing protein